MFNKMKDTGAVKADLITVQGNENSTRKLLNKRVPEIVEGVIAGDNVSMANMTVRVCVGHRKREMFIFLNHCLPFDFDKDSMKFTRKSKDEKFVKIKEDNFRAFKESGMTVFGWLDANVKTDKKPVNYASRITNAVKSGLKHDLSQHDAIIAAFDGGLTTETILAVLDEIARREAEEMPDDVADAA